MLPIDPIEPTLPMDSIDPRDPMQSTDSREPIESIESRDHSDQRDSSIRHYGARPTLAGLSGRRSHVLIRDAQVDGRQTSVRVRDGLIEAVSGDLTGEAGELVIGAGGGALIPGLHDHHLHLFAMAAARESTPVGPAQVHGPEEFAAALTAAAAGAREGRWVRAVGYHESVAGELDREVLDRIEARTPIRVQHRGGALWVLNSAALQRLSLPSDDSRIERDAAGQPTGRLLRWDTELRQQLTAVEGAAAPDLGRVGAMLAAFGITGVTDATPDLESAAVRSLQEAAGSGALPQQLLLLGAPLQGLPPPAGRLAAGPFKLLLHDHALPSFDELCERIAAAHDSHRAVAVHCVTRESLLLTLAALEGVGAVPGDRVEHAAVVPSESRSQLLALGLRVVTQPGFIAERGEQYLRDVDAEDRALLYPYASLLTAGLAVAPSSDAPFGSPDPWRVIAAAARRRTTGGISLGAPERVPARTALDGYLSPLTDPGGAARRIRPGAPADLCLLSGPLQAVLDDPRADRVRAVVAGGCLVHHA